MKSLVIVFISKDSRYKKIFIKENINQFSKKTVWILGKRISFVKLIIQGKSQGVILAYLRRNKGVMEVARITSLKSTMNLRSEG